jgi:general secretion pathway protein K
MALLVAILLVALGTMIAATIGYESAMAVRRATSTYAFDQSILIAQGAEGLAAYALRAVWQSSGSNRSIYPGQAWSQHVGPFPILPGVMLEAQLEDLEGRFNINSLVKPDLKGIPVPDPQARKAFEQLLTMVGLETRWSGYVIDWIDPDIEPQSPEGAEDSVYLGQDPPYLTPNKYITSITELLALPGFGEERYRKLAPYITALPPDVKINVCTASPQVLDAFLQGNHEFSIDPEGFAKNRAAASGCYPSMSDYTTVYNHANPTTSVAQGSAAGVANPAVRGGRSASTEVGVTGYFQSTSTYFRLTSHITTDSGAEFNVYSLLYQDQSQGAVRPILRSYTPD